jgi:NADH-quinone oxidoreductase subunit F
MNSLEGRRGNPRIKPPFPAVAGLFGQPTTINNVETLVAAAQVVKHGAEWYKAFCLSSPKSTGTKLFSVCGNIARPGNYEVVLGFPFKEFLWDLCGGAPGGRTIKAVIPGGSSVPILTAAECEGAIMDYEGFQASGTMLGSGGVIVFDDQQDMVKQIARLTRFYAHESCAQCSQCREGTAWTTRIMERLARGEGNYEDLDTLLEIGEGMSGKTICVLSDSCAVPVASGLKKFRPEFEAKIAKKQHKAFVLAPVSA